MGHIDEEKYRRVFAKARMRFGVSFYGHSEQMRCRIVWDGKEQNPEHLGDEQLMIVSQLLGKAREPLVRELTRRDLLPSAVHEKKANRKK